MKNILLSFIFVFLITHVNAQNTYYGTTEEGGDGGGTIFSVLSDGTNHTVEYTWEEPEYSPSNQHKFVESSSGIVYGTIESGGAKDGGVIFKYLTGTGEYSVVYEFENSTGWRPRGGLTKASNGKLYGTASGGSGGNGVIYEFDPTTDTYTKLFDFVSATGTASTGFFESGGILYGATLYGGSAGMGVIFEYDISTDIYTVIHHFDNTIGERPYAPPVLASNGKFYGTTTAGGANNDGAMYEYDPAGPTIVKVHDFLLADGKYPQALLHEASGKLYGLTRQGGAGSGTIFEFDLITQVFAKKIDLTNTTGTGPLGAFTSIAGELYFTTNNGGPSWGGTISKYDPVSNSTTTLHGLSSSDTGGAYPNGTLLLASNGKLYGGNPIGGLGNRGTIFEYDYVSDNYLVVKLFNNPIGEKPTSGLMLGPNNLLYGVTSKGGDYGSGVLYSFNHSTKEYTKLHDFDEPTGSNPSGTTIMVGDKLYGFTRAGGQNTYNGTIYEYDLTSSIYSVLHSFQFSDGTQPQGEPVYFNSKIYGVTSSSGGSGSGTIFEFDPTTAQFNIKYNRQSTDGSLESGLMVANNGSLYGATSSGGTSSRGILYEYNLISNLYTIRYNFNSEGYYVSGKLMQAANGNLYGVTVYDPSIFEYNPSTLDYTQKATLSNPYNRGTLFEPTPGLLLGMTDISPHGSIFNFDISTNSLTQTHIFDGSDGSYPGKSFIVNTTNIIQDQYLPG